MFNYFKKFIDGLKNSRFVNQQDAPSKEPEAEKAPEGAEMEFTPAQTEMSAEELARLDASEKLKEAVDAKMEATRAADKAAAAILAEKTETAPEPNLEGLEGGASSAKTELAQVTKEVKEDEMVFTPAQTEMSAEELAKADKADELKKAVDDKIAAAKAKETADEESKKILEEGV